ncbi:MAG: heme-binding domain-containing protein [bacterium]|nr:heme-binding domain-containing protein [bacterium]
MKRKWAFGILILSVLVLIQFIPIERNNPPIEMEVPATPEVKEILQRVCYNCHSYETTWPWYGYVAPLSWLVAYDVNEARRKMNFSAWNRLDSEKASKRIQEIWEEVEEGEMPPWYYRIVHPEADLSEQEKQLIHEWTIEARGKP